MKSTKEGLYKSKINKDIVELLFSEKSKFTTDILASELKPDEALLLRQALTYANMIRIAYGKKVANLYIDGVLRTISAFRKQAEKDSSQIS